MGKGFSSLWGRWVFWQAGWSLIKSQPWLGYGLGHFQGAYPQGASILALTDGAPLSLPEHAHNDWIEIAVEIGAIPAALILCIAIYAVWRSWDIGLRYLSLALGAFILQAGWDSPLYSAPTALLFWMLFGCANASTPNRSQRLYPYMIITIVIISLFAFSGSGQFLQRLQGHLVGEQARYEALQGNWKSATSLWGEARALAPSDGAFGYWLTQGLMVQGKYATALETGREAVKTYPRFHLYILLAQLEANQGNEEDAIDVLEWLLRGFPQYIPAQDLLDRYE